MNLHFIVYLRYVILDSDEFLAVQGMQASCMARRRRPWTLQPSWIELDWSAEMAALQLSCRYFTGASSIAWRLCTALHTVKLTLITTPRQSPGYCGGGEMEGSWVHSGGLRWQLKLATVLFTQSRSYVPFAAMLPKATMRQEQWILKFLLEPAPPL